MVSTSASGRPPLFAVCAVSSVPWQHRTSVKHTGVQDSSYAKWCCFLWGSAEAGCVLCYFRKASSLPAAPPSPPKPSHLVLSLSRTYILSNILFSFSWYGICHLELGDKSQLELGGELRTGSRVSTPWWCIPFLQYLRPFFPLRLISYFGSLASNWDSLLAD